MAFSGFANDTTWFIFGAMIFGMMATKSGLAKRITYAIMSRAGSSYSRLLLALDRNKVMMSGQPSKES